MSIKLAVHGGPPVFAAPLDFTKIWPPLTQRTEAKLVELYRSRKWTAFDAPESAFAIRFAEYHGCSRGVFTINGTVTLQCALAACGVGSGDEVIVPPLTWYATAIAVRHVGAVPVFVDIDPNTLCIDPARIEAAIGPRTKAIIPVHAYRSMADMDAIMAIARRHGLRVIEDCAHMHGGILNGKAIGSIGDVGSFSFQNTKTMSCGEGGICITNDLELADRIFRMKQIGYGLGEQPRHARTPPPPDLLCFNYRATAFHPIILDEQLDMLANRLETYTQAATYLEARLTQSTHVRFQQGARNTHRRGCFGWMMLFDHEDYIDVPIALIQQAIAAEGLPIFRAEGPIFRFVLFNVDPSNFRLADPCEVTEKTCARGLWLLHMYLGLEKNQVSSIAESIEKVCDNIDSLRSLASTGGVDIEADRRALIDLD